MYKDHFPKVQKSLRSVSMPIFLLEININIFWVYNKYKNDLSLFLHGNSSFIYNLSIVATGSPHNLALSSPRSICFISTRIINFISTISVYFTRTRSTYLALDLSGTTTFRGGDVESREYRRVLGL